MKFQITLTDTFGGEPNFSWVRRYEFDADETASDTELVLIGLELIGGNINDIDYQDLGDQIILLPKDESDCQIAFIEIS